MGQRQLPSWFWRAVIAVGFSVLVFIGVRSTIEKLTSLLGILFISLFLSFAIEPAVNHLADRGWRRGRATIACFVLLFGVGGVFLTVMVSLVVSQVADLVDQAPTYITDATNWANDTFGTEITSTELNTGGPGLPGRHHRGGHRRRRAGRVAHRLAARVVFQAFTVALFSYYMISQGPQMRRNVCSLLPPRRQQMVLRLWELAIEKTGGWVYSRLLLADDRRDHVVDRVLDPRPAVAAGARAVARPGQPVHPRGRHLPGRRAAGVRRAAQRPRRCHLGAGLDPGLPADRELPAVAAHHRTDHEPAPCGGVRLRAGGRSAVRADGRGARAARPRRSSRPSSPPTWTATT